jgi:hypothetical protein
MRLSPALAAYGLIALLTWTELLLRVLVPALARGSWQTSAYWVAPRLAWDGAVALLWDPLAFGDAAVRLGAVRDMGFLPHPPSGVLPLLPFGLLPELAAFQIWTLVGLIALSLAAVFLLVTLRFSAAAGLAVLALVPLFRPLRANIAEGQAYIFVLVALLLAGAWAARSIGRAGSACHCESRVWTADLLAGLALGALGILKLYYGLVLLLPALVHRRWVIVATAVAGMGAAVVLTVLLWGLEGWAIWLDATLSWRSRPETVVTAYQTVHSLFGQLFRYDAAWNPGQVADLPWLAEFLWYTAALAIVGASVVVFARHSRRMGGSILVPVAAIVPVGLLLSPVAQDTHYLLMIFPLIVAGRSIAPAGDSYRAGAAGRPHAATLAAWAVLAVAFLLLAAPWNPNVPDFEGWSALLRYPRVYGALLLWGLLLWLTWRADGADGADVADAADGADIADVADGADRAARDP